MSWRTNAVLALAVLALLWGCGSRNTGVEGTNQFTSREYNFEISVTDTMSRSGWFIIKEEDAALSHIYVPPDSSQGINVAVVIPPAASFPAFAPFNVDVFRLEDGAATAEVLADIRALQVAEVLRSRRSRTINNRQAEEIIYGLGTEVTYETLFSRDGLGYSINSLGATLPSGPAAGFFINPTAYENVVQSFRFLQ
jgi:hypothetical protein